MLRYSKGRRSLIIASTVAAILVGLLFLAVGCFTLVTVAQNLVGGDSSMAGHASQYLMIALFGTVLGAGSLVMGGYSLKVTKRFRFQEKVTPKSRWLAAPTITSIIVGVSLGMAAGSITILDLISSRMSFFENPIAAMFVMFVVAIEWFIAASGIYLLSTTNSFAHWNSKSPARNRLLAIVVWVGLALNLLVLSVLPLITVLILPISSLPFFLWCPPVPKKSTSLAIGVYCLVTSLLCWNSGATLLVAGPGSVAGLVLGYRAKREMTEGNASDRHISSGIALGWVNAGVSALTVLALASLAALAYRLGM